MLERNEKKGNVSGEKERGGKCRERKKGRRREEEKKRGETESDYR